MRGERQRADRQGRAAACAAALLAAACLAASFAPVAAAPRGEQPTDAYGHADLAGGGTIAGLAMVRWISEAAGERRVDVYAFDCAHGRYAHVVSERHRGATRLERVALADSRWAMALQPLPPTYPVLAVHRARDVACPPPRRRP